MEFTEIAGRSVSRIGLGTWAIGGREFGSVSDAEAVACCLAALDHGINLIDTAPIYGHGRSEEIVGKAIREHGRRESFYIATKAGLDWDRGPDQPGVFTDSRPERLRKEIEASLRRLGTDFIDLYQVHWPDPLEPVAETAAVMREFLHEGKVRALGVSNFSVAQMEEFRQIAPLSSNQPPYNLFERQIDADILPWCANNGVSTLAYSSLCRSLLGGRTTRAMKFAAGDIRSVDPKFQEPRLSQYLDAVDKLGEYANSRYDKTIVDLAVRWVLDSQINGQPAVSAALWGAKRPEQLTAVTGVLDWTLDEEAMTEIDRIVAECVKDPVGPEYLTPQKRA